MGLFEEIFRGNPLYGKSQEEQKLNKELFEEYMKRSEAERNSQYKNDFSSYSYTGQRQQKTYYDTWVHGNVSIRERPEDDGRGIVYIIKADDSDTVIRITQNKVFEYVREKNGLNNHFFGQLGVHITQDDVLKCAYVAFCLCVPKIREKEIPFQKKPVILGTKVLTKSIPSEYPDWDYESPCL